MKLLPVCVISFLFAFPAGASTNRLNDDVRRIQDRIENSFRVDGLVVNAELDPATGKIAQLDETLASSALYTGLYLASQCLAYGPEKSDSIQNTLSALDRLFEVTGNPAMMASFAFDPNRSDFKITGLSPSELSAKKGWRTSHSEKTQGWKWLGETTRDQYVGVIFGLSVCNELASDSEIQRQAGDRILAITSALAKNQWEIPGKSFGFYQVSRRALFGIRVPKGVSVSVPSAHEISLNFHQGLTSQPLSSAVNDIRGDETAYRFQIYMRQAFGHMAFRIRARRALAAHQTIFPELPQFYYNFNPSASEGAVKLRNYFNYPSWLSRYLCGFMLTGFDQPKSPLSSIGQPAVLQEAWKYTRGDNAFFTFLKISAIGRGQNDEALLNRSIQELTHLAAQERSFKPSHPLSTSRLRTQAKTPVLAWMVAPGKARTVASGPVQANGVDVLIAYSLGCRFGLLVGDSCPTRF